LLREDDSKQTNKEGIRKLSCDGRRVRCDLTDDLSRATGRILCIRSCIRVDVLEAFAELGFGFRKRGEEHLVRGQVLEEVSTIH
jgi:hypothetical protein